jgi:arylsulfatase A-like enzyme
MMVLFITVDALRYDTVNTHFMPTICELSKQSHVFENAYATGSMTPSSFPSLLGSYYCISQCTNNFFPDKPCVAKVFRNAGFKTVGIQAANPYLTSYFNYGLGFDDFVDFIPSAKTSKNLELSRFGFWKEFKRNIFQKAWAYGKAILLDQSPQIDAYRVTKLALDKINYYRNSNNLFVWLHYMDMHNPLVPPKAHLPHSSTLRYSRDIIYALKAYSDKFTASHIRVRAVQQLYGASAKHLDVNIKHLFSKLSEKSLYEDALIILTSDHGEAFMEHNALGHPPNNLYEEQIHVPLIVKLPGQKQPHRHLKKVSHIDLFPSIFARLEIERPADFQGKDILFSSNFDNHPIFACGKSKSGKWKTACICSDWKLITLFESAGAKAIELYNLKRDPEEKTNLVLNNTQTVAQLLTYSEVFYNAYKAKDEIAEEKIKNEEIEHRLKQLGYL